jgi:glutamate dehydrogenase (NAD(P)+)
MLDEFEAIERRKLPGFITGKPVGMGGSLGRTEATGYGVIFTLREALQELGMDPAETRASVQGFGNVSQYAIELFNKLGGTVTCVSCWDQEDQTSYSYRKHTGVVLDELRAVTDRFGGIDKAKARDLGYDVLPGGAWLEEEVEVLLPCALENQINGENVASIKPSVKIVAEGANGPTTPEADAVLSERGILVIADFLANAGGVTCSYFEQVQCNTNYFWEKEEVLAKLDLKMTAAFHAVHELAKKRKLFMRDAAYVISISRVAQACRDRGWV